MTDHKFEPFQKVLVRDGNSKLWRADFFSYNDGDGEFPFCCVREDWRFCVPYTPETAHLLGTSQPYEPPKPPQEYDLVEALEQAEAENDRLTKMVDWLAGKLSEHCLADGGDCNILICPTYIACRNATPKVWKEAARRVVADANSEVK